MKEQPEMATGPVARGSRWVSWDETSSLVVEEGEASGGCGLCGHGRQAPVLVTRRPGSEFVQTLDYAREPVREVLLFSRTGG